MTEDGQTGYVIAPGDPAAIAEAVAGKKSEFLRTPKRGDRELKRYTRKAPWPALAEIAIGLYTAVAFGLYLGGHRYFVSPFLAIYAAGFLFVGILTILHAAGIGIRRT